MYMYAWKEGSRPPTTCAPVRRRRSRRPRSTTSPRRGRTQSRRPRCRRLLAREPPKRASACQRVLLENHVLRACSRAPASTTPCAPPRPRQCLTLRPMRIPFYEMYRDAIKNTWTVEEVDFSDRPRGPRTRMTPAERHLIQRLVAFFATGDSIVSNNLVLNLYRHINSPEARMYLSRQLYEEALHVQFYLTLLDTYVPDPTRARAASRPSRTSRRSQEGATSASSGWTRIQKLDRSRLREHRRQFLLNLICFAACIEGLFFFAAFAYVYFLRSRACSTASRLAPTGCSATRAANGVRFRGIKTVRARSPSCSTPSSKRRS